MLTNVRHNDLDLRYLCGGMVSDCTPCVGAKTTRANQTIIFTGTYSWGPNWEKAKGQAECLDYLLEIAVKMRQVGLLTVGL